MRRPDFGLVHILRALLNLTPVRSFVKTANTSFVPRWAIVLAAGACAIALFAEVRHCPHCGDSFFSPPNVPGRAPFPGLGQ
jgi:hypothetical protein